MELEEGRTLTDKDVEAVVKAFKKEFYLEVGQGFWSYTWKAILIVLVGIAASNFLHK